MVLYGDLERGRTVKPKLNATQFFHWFTLAFLPCRAISQGCGSWSPAGLQLFPWCCLSFPSEQTTSCLRWRSTATLTPTLSFINIKLIFFTSWLMGGKLLLTFLAVVSQFPYPPTVLLWLFGYNILETRSLAEEVPGPQIVKSCSMLTLSYTLS